MIDWFVVLIVLYLDDFENVNKEWFDFDILNIYEVYLFGGISG